MFIQMLVRGLLVLENTNQALHVQIHMFFLLDMTTTFVDVTEKIIIDELKLVQYGYPYAPHSEYRMFKQVHKEVSQ